MKKYIFIIQHEGSDFKYYIVFRIYKTKEGFWNRYKRVVPSCVYCREVNGVSFSEVTEGRISGTEILLFEKTADSVIFHEMLHAACACIRAERGVETVCLPNYTRTEDRRTNDNKRIEEELANICQLIMNKYFAWRMEG